MRRNDKEITEQQDLDAIMKKAQVCRLAVSYEGMAYIIPMSFGLLIEYYIFILRTKV
ncbi:hypothetical protein [Desulfosporosinus sp. OT]|uniref:hypothetical protein n=1 Tax=Desulfosporosinus sp. OT TaxID=913865 RepID=UPI0002239C0B|nr:hypothetical protein [Desulfosporosinus sp. OT]EGW36743.1 hypothetical protein DOT_5424 [Desulfosporosinus sp. OT]